MANIGDRFKTGQTCVESGVYKFNGYLDGTSTPEPTAEEKEIPLSYSEKFPAIKSANKACWWKLIRKA